MSPSPQLAPAGSSTYTSNSMYVGDGTWDTDRNTFLLPNLVGLNFATMRYNGMGNRFREMPQYRSLIRAHGTIAAIVFLFLVPTAILVRRFHKRNYRWALRIHVWFQILTVILLTAAIILSFIAVGPPRNLTNPHHGIGLALYVLVLVQFFGGWWIHRKERSRRMLYLSVKVMLHHWLGRVIALLGLAQIPLGLTLYGSPVALFVLYALAAFALVVIYFILEYVQERHYDSEYDSRYSYGTGSVVEEGRRHSRTGDLLKGGAAGAGLAALANRLRNRSRSRDRADRPEVRPEVVGSRRHSGSFIEDEKYYADEEHGGGWRDRLLKIGAVGGAAAAAKSFFDRRRNRDRDSDTGDYGPPLGGDVPINRRNSLSRIDEGAPLPTGQHPLNQPLRHRRSTSSMTYSSYMSASQEGRGHGLRDAVAGLGALGLARNIFKKRRERKEQKRLDQQIERERLDRERNQRLTGDGTPRRQRRHGSVTTSTDLTESTDPFPGRGPILGNPRPVPAGVYPGTAAPPIIPPPGTQASNLPPPPPHGIHPTASNPVMTGAAPVQQASMPPLPPDPQGILHQNYSGSESSASNQRPGRDAAAAALAGATGGGLAAGAASRQRDRSRHHSGSGGSVASPPVSVKVKMHSDGRHVTLRRLPEEEAAATREARRKERSSRRRRGSGSDLSAAEGASARRWRRTEALERQQQQQQQEAAEQARRQENERLLAQQQQQSQPPQPQYLQPPMPQPPPIPESATGRPLATPGAGSVGSPGTDYGNTTEASAEYASNRKRRRAERAQAKLARDQGRSGTVEFT